LFFFQHQGAKVRDAKLWIDKLDDLEMKKSKFKRMAETNLWFVKLGSQRLHDIYPLGWFLRYFFV
jgi:hypothetical protein